MITRKDLNGVIDHMENVANDSGIPRNIRKSVSDAKDRLTNGGQDVDLTSAIYTLDECLNDINMPFHVRPELMEIISQLERIKEDAK